MISLQTTEQIHDVLTWNDATIPGILITVVLAFGYVIYFLFKTNQRLYQEFTTERDRLYRDHLGEIKAFNELLIKINNQYHDSIRSLVDLHKK